MITTIKNKTEDKAVVTSACLGGIFDGFDASIYVLVLFPAVSELIHSQSHEQVGPIGAAILAVFMLGWAVGAIIFGHICDRVGTIRTMTYTVLLYAISTALCAISHSWQEMAFYRFLAGCGIGGEQGAGAILLSEQFKNLQVSKRYLMLGLMTASLSIGWWLSSGVNFLLGHFGWRYVFLCGLAPAFLAFYMRSRLFRSVLNSSEIIVHKSFLETVNNLFALHLQKIFTVLLLSIAAIVNWWAVLSWIPAWINQLTGQLAVEERSLTGFITYGGAIASAILGASLLSRLGRRTTLAIAFSGCLVADVVMFLGIRSFGIPLLFCTFWVGFFAGLPFLCLFILVPELFPRGTRGTAFGISLQAGRIFGAVAALTGGQIIHAFHGSYAAAGSCVALVNILGLVSAFFVPKYENFILDEAQFEDTKPDQELVLAKR